MKWQPIETASKEVYSDELLLFYEAPTKRQGVAYWDADMKLWKMGWSSCYCEPTHWMPLPKQPIN